MPREAQLAGLLVERRDTKVDATRTVNVLHAPTVARTEEEWLKSVADYYASQGKPDPGANDHAH